MQVFEHGQLRLYLLSILAHGPRHGYDIIRALEDRFEGLYSPSAGTVYPRLAKLEEEGLVERLDEGRKASYRITDAGRSEVQRRAQEIADLDASLDASAQRLAQDVRQRVRTGAADLRTQLAAAAQAARAQASAESPAQAAATASSSASGTEPSTEPGDVWARVTDSVADSLGGVRAGAHPLADVEGLLRAFGGGKFPDTDVVAQALRRMGMTRPPESSSAHGKPAQATAAEPEPVADLDEEIIEAEIVTETASSGDSTHEGTRHEGFPSPQQVREIVEILKDAGTRIQAVLKEPRS
ncbi:PadR family transcriptional regulator [Gephyromycinifex aptenodytis]|uniref:PadR family transcriptional regulator n=1 Tax=Gephyromycinifex aptenodytis TaxID=2716227 RepID=UPI001444C1BB|nr:PadR family transcriptional regulator [Gephyromycinifex aptenodytis]